MSQKATDKSSPLQSLPHQPGQPFTIESGSPSTHEDVIVSKTRRRGSSLVGLAQSALLDINPQPGAWAAAGTAIARAPAISELREPGLGEDLQVDEHGHTTIHVVEEDVADLAEGRDLARKAAKTNLAARRRSSVGARLDARQHGGSGGGKLISPGIPAVSETITDAQGPIIEAVKSSPQLLSGETKRSEPSRLNSQEGASPPAKHTHLTALRHLLSLLWKFVKTPTGFLFTLYMLNIIAWGGMLFLLELKAAPAMDHPGDGDADNSPRKKWLEIDSQILNALFCVTGFGLAPWRFRDAFFSTMARWGRRGENEWGRRAMRRVTMQNRAWFRPPAWYLAVCEEGEETDPVGLTATGTRARSTALWKLDFVVWMMVANTGFQIVLSYYMWHYGRLDRPGWATGTFIGCGCGVALLSGLMVWWEGRKVKGVEGLKVKLVQQKMESAAKDRNKALTEKSKNPKV